MSFETNRQLYDPVVGETVDAATINRDDLNVGSTVVGPGLPDLVAAFGIKSGGNSPLRALLSSYPDIDDRIAALQS